MGSEENGAEPAEHSSGPPATIDPQLAEIVEGLPIEKRQVVMRVMRQLEHHQGPLPSPKSLEKYNEVLPGLAERIVCMTEREQQHRHSIYEKMVNDEFNLKRWGQILAFAVVTLLVGYGVYLASNGQAPAGAEVVKWTVVGLATAFISGRVVGIWDKRDREDEEQ